MNNLPIPQPTSSLNAWLNYIKHLHIKTIDLSLERVHYVANKLNLLQPAPWIITVGGTNGKSTTCHLLETILLATDIKVGVYSSPHLLRYTERIRIQGQELTEDAHSKAMAIIEAGRGTTSLSYFEFSTLSAFQLFKQAMLEVVILEVGLGGRLDATNIVNADVSVITNIAIDHSDLLGSDRASIAREKSGIFRYNKPAVIGDYNRPKTIDTAINKCGAILFARDRDWWFHLEKKNWRWWNQKYILEALPIPTIPLANAATALATIHCLPFLIPETSIRTGLNVAFLPGRFQIVKQHPLVILDVAHNPHAIHYLANRLTTIQRTGTIRAIVGMLANKDISGSLLHLKDLITVWYCSSLENEYTATAAQLASYLHNETQQFTNVLSAWDQVMADSQPEDCVIVFGSFHTVAPIITLLKKNI